MLNWVPAEAKVSRKQVAGVTQRKLEELRNSLTLHRAADLTPNTTEIEFNDLNWPRQSLSILFSRSKLPLIKRITTCSNKLMVVECWPWKN